MAILQRITPCLWFDDQAEAAARYYVSIFDNAAIGDITRYGREGVETHGRPEGTVLTVSFRLEGLDFIALNGGPRFRFTEAVSFAVLCETQAEIDHYWDRLREGGDEKAQQCGWLKDKYGVSWQIVPAALRQMLQSTDGGAGWAMQALLGMRKLDLAALRRAFDGA